jgi:hypothetical protein
MTQSLCMYEYMHIDTHQRQRSIVVLELTVIPEHFPPSGRAELSNTSIEATTMYLDAISRFDSSDRPC